MLEQRLSNGTGQSQSHGLFGSLPAAASCQLPAASCLLCLCHDLPKVKYSPKLWSWSILVASDKVEPHRPGSGRKAMTCTAEKEYLSSTFWVAIPRYCIYQLMQRIKVISWHIQHAHDDPQDILTVEVVMYPEGTRSLSPEAGESRESGEWNQWSLNILNYLELCRRKAAIV